MVTDKAKPLVKEKRSRSLPSLLLVIFAAAIGGALVEQYFNTNGAVGDSTTNTSFLASYVSTKSPKLPKRIEEGTIWETVSASQDEVLFTYRIEDAFRDNMSIEDVAGFAQVAEMPISNVICSSGEYSPFFSRNIMVTYIYLGARGKEIARFHFTQGKCKRL